ncbi:cytochrome-c peroxidase [Citreicoccus inhibens]|uniref:cytochrome-c peroxidase n=1 Tax=Citreicoccus inhibens TaxID=2849499 RepID=UPI001EEFADF4|nr:cytochrome-c peroxidase [Citreicoccus inhibens]
MGSLQKFIGLISALALGGLAQAAPPNGKELFLKPFPGTNGRSCATCHVLEEETVLTPQHVEALWAQSPTDPLFNRLDADDPSAAILTYSHLKKGLVRVTLPVPANMDVIDAAGNVITPANRKISVWRGVPSVRDTAILGPYQYDGREASLQSQAQSAILSHSEGSLVSPEELDAIAIAERDDFTSDRARFVSNLFDWGVPLAFIPDPERFMWLTPQEQRGRDVYTTACEGCHGGSTKNRIVNRAVHDAAFLALKPNGTVIFTVDPQKGPVLQRVPRPNDEFLNVGFTFLSYLGQVGQLPMYNSDVQLPRYRFRFYTDGTRQHAVTELPPVPVTVSGDPLDPRSALDSNGFPIVGPNGAPQLFTTDPGRALITGDPADFEAFDIPSLRGVAKTAPYFHDNSNATLVDVVNTYSRLILPFLPDMHLPAVHPPEDAQGFPESLTPAQKQDLLAFLNRL